MRGMPWRPTGALNLRRGIGDGGIDRWISSFVDSHHGVVLREDLGYVLSRNRLVVL